MKEYDSVVVGSGSGMEFVEKALSHEETVALIDKGPLGGTCLNLGCIPSKMLIFPADRIMEIKEAKKLGIEAKITHIDFKSIMERMRTSINDNRENMRKGVKDAPLDYYEKEAHFVDDHTLQVGKEKIKGKKIFLVSGARPFIPPIKGLEKTEYLTNESVLGLKKRPESLIIVGGGYIVAEYSHFFDAMGTKVTIVQRNERLLPDEEPEISNMLKKQMEKRMNVHTNMEAFRVKKEEGRYRVKAKNKKTNITREFSSEKIMIATGRKSNAELLKVENTGVEVDERGFIKVNEKWETSKKNIWALGDAVGKSMFKHVANREAAYCSQNVFHNTNLSLDYHTVPHAVFSHPQVASVGLKEKEAKEIYGNDVLVGGAKYSDVAKGEAMMDDCGFVKSIINKDGKILGFHIIGPYAPILIQEVVNVIAKGGNIWDASSGMHIHPSLSEVILSGLQPQERELLKIKFICQEQGRQSRE
ncbi:dihydrolipoyl dehydrogenase [bacterium]|nr:dihydrolipoyl dehydrogenase [bacterium]